MNLLDCKWNRLRLDPHQVLPVSLKISHTKYRFICDCGGSKEISWASVLRGLSKSCGCLNREARQNKVPFAVGDKFGRLTVQSLDHKRNHDTYNGQSFWKCLCDCGKQVIVSASHIKSGHTSSCGCYMKDRTSENNFHDLKGLTFGALTVGTVSGIGQGGKYRWNVVCTCGNHTVVYGDSLVQGLTKSCGCMRKGQGEYSPATKIVKFLQEQTSLSIKTEVLVSEINPQFQGKNTVDIWIPELMLAIEFHGLPWHSERYSSGKRDHEKFLTLRNHARLVQIYSDEWRDKQGVMESFLQGLVKSRSSKRIKPVFELFSETPIEARQFLDTYHYLGSASQLKNKGVTVLARYGYTVVGVWVFMKREEDVILWHRASWNHEYRAWNPHEKALALAVPELVRQGFKKMVTFSDNRFHTGALYEKLGFTFEHEIEPNYYYTNGFRRISKYSLRVKAGFNEVETAKEKGWYRIWDSGKRRYSLSLI